MRKQVNTLYLIKCSNLHYPNKKILKTVILTEMTISFGIYCSDMKGKWKLHKGDLIVETEFTLKVDLRIIITCD